MTGADLISGASVAGGADYVRLVELSKRFGAFLAVDRVSLRIARGEIFCLLGASGSGKTTLLRMLAGFETPSSGQLLLDGQDLTQVPPYRRPLNMMFQSYALFPHMDVERNVAFGLEQERLGRDEIRRRVGEILEVVRMGEYRARRPHQLSGGQRQRVALARALVKRPKLLLLDEPLAALDRKLREHTQFELINVQQQLGVTFIVVTHDQEEAMTLATRIGVMNQGALVQVGSPREIYEQPATRFVADFIGSVNLLEAQVQERGAAGWQLQCAELPAPLLIERCSGGQFEGLHAGSSLWVALRPEQISLSRAAPGQPHNWAQGVVREVAYRGEVSVVLVRLSSGRELRVTLTNAGRAGSPVPMRDESVYLSWHADAAVLGAA
ncbi:MAG TPA: ABC transporter ATP-binding protein [Steroidobacteraceae bacterium]|nr:ABC transporter ATP-binding protein [Steroidobacteraceae bacterium]